MDNSFSVLDFRPPKFRSWGCPVNIPIMSCRHPVGKNGMSVGHVRDVECPITSPLKSHTYPNHVLRASHGNPSFGTKADTWTSRGRPRESHGKNRMSLGHPSEDGGESKSSRGKASKGNTVLREKHPMRKPSKLFRNVLQRENRPNVINCNF